MSETNCGVNKSFGGGKMFKLKLKNGAEASTLESFYQLRSLSTFNLPTAPKHFNSHSTAD